MAVIREEYVLGDRFSGTFNRLLNLFQRSNRAAQAAAASQQRFTAASGRLNTSLGRTAGAAARTSSALTSMNSKTTDLSGKTERAASAQDRMNKSMRGGGNAASGLTKRILSLAGAYVSLRSAQKFINMSDTFVQTKARLDRMNDGKQSTPELQDMIYQSAMRSRGSYQDMVDMVGKLGTMAPEAFSSNRELVAFAEQINKQFTLAGTSTQGVQAAMLQLTQAMSSGVLRGEELNSVLEQAPTIAQSIAKYMGVSIGEMRELASEGRITADVVKAAMFSAAEETNAAFEKIPMTFGQAWTMASNAAVRAFEPAMQKLNDLLNSELGQKALDGLISAFELLGSIASWVIDLLAQGAQWVADNWDFVSMVLQFAAGALMALALTSAAAAAVHMVSWAIANWPVTLLILVIGAAIAAMYQMGMTSEEVGAKIGAVFGWLYTLGYNLVAAAWNLIATFAEFFANVFDNPVTAIANLFLGLFNFIMDIVSNAAGAIDALLGSNISGAVKGFQNKVNDFVHSIFGENEVKIARMDPLDYQATMDKFSATGASIGKALDNFSFGGAFGKAANGPSFDYSAMLGSIPGDLGGIKNDTGAIKRSVAMSEEDIKMLVDMAERKYINNVNLTAQTPVINVHGQNTGNSEADAVWLADTLQRMLIEQAASHTDLNYT
jgi:tape measure domain-containing protein